MTWRCNSLDGIGWLVWTFLPLSGNIFELGSHLEPSRPEHLRVAADEVRQKSLKFFSLQSSGGQPRINGRPRRGMSKRWASVILALILTLFGFQYVLLSRKNTLILRQSQTIHQINSTLSHLRQQQPQTRTFIESSSRLTKETIAQKLSPSKSISKLEMPTSRELKPLPVSSWKRAVLFTMDSIGSCENQLISLFLWLVSIFLSLDESDSKNGGAAGNSPSWPLSRS
jgi:hypothetical protein